ncbi:MAG: hypothetical protein ACREDK_06345 [Thermoplasmata archaeon]
MQRGGGVKAFAATPVGRAVLVAISILALTGCFVYLGTLLAIAALLLFSLAIPIYLGWKRPRQLAVAGLVVLLIASPIASVIATEQFRTPAPASSSSNQAPDGYGGAVLENARVTPYTGAGGAIYHFSVDLHPNFAPPNTHGLLWVVVYVSTCPGALTPTSSLCPSGFSFAEQNRTFANGTTLAQTVDLNVTLNGTGIWWWNMATAVQNATTGAVSWIWVQATGGYNAIEGPVSGDFTSTLSIVIPSVYVTMFFYPGLIFFAAILAYAFFKSREARRKREESGPPATLGPTSGPRGGPAAPAAPPGQPETKCSNCGAVIFSGETTCWKCGVAMGKGSSPPLASK